MSHQASGSQRRCLWTPPGVKDPWTPKSFAFLWVVLWLVQGCSVDASADDETPRFAALPSDDGPFAPSQARPQGAQAPDWLDDVDACTQCHQEVAGEWRRSGHAAASFSNPFYRFNVDAFRAHVGRDASQHCGGCHDVALLLDGDMTADVEPDDPRGHMGVTCGACHSVQAASFDGNGSHRITNDPIAFPEGDDVTAHAARVSSAGLRSSAFCVSCHRGFLGSHTGNVTHLPGLSEPRDWARSAQAGSGLARIDDPVDRASCVDCHMPIVSDGEKSWRSHQFHGGHTALAAARGDAQDLATRQKFLQGVASIDVAAITQEGAAPCLIAESCALPSGARVTLDVVLRNLEVGHRFPEGRGICRTPGWRWRCGIAAATCSRGRAWRTARAERTRRRIASA